VITTHTHDDFECPNRRYYVDTKSWLAYEQNPYSTYWVRSSSCHREISLGYDILTAITWLQANMNIWLLHNATTPRCSKLESCTTLPHLVQPWVAVPLPAWLNNIITNMTRYLHCVVAKSPRQHRCQHDSIALSPAWLDICITPWPSRLGSAFASMTWYLHRATTKLSCSMTRHLHHITTKLLRQHCRQHDLTSTSRRGQVASAASSRAWLDNIVASMTQHLHRAMAKSPRQRHREHDSAALSPAWLSIYIASWPDHPDSVVTSMTQQHHHQHDSAYTSHHGQVTPAAPSLACLDLYITPRPSRLGNVVVSMTW
jgi:hypothetical protein